MPKQRVLTVVAFEESVLEQIYRYSVDKLGQIPIVEVNCHSPNMSEDTGVRKMSPVNSHVVCFASIPEVPSNT